MRRLVVVAAAALSLAIAGGACSSPPPVASNAVPPPVQADTKPVVWAALGGDETLSPDQKAAPNAWTQRVLSRLPASAQLVDLATEDAPLQAGLSSQLNALAASPSPPTVATVWFGSAEPNTPKAQFTQGLTTLVTQLQAAGVQRVILVARPDAPGDRGYRYSTEIQSVAAATGASFVSVTALTTNPGDPAAQSAIADQLAPQIAGG